jgi:choline dehydrogenase-like flavoprotein
MTGPGRGFEMTPQFDAIVIGSGITGGWAAKELTQKGLKVLMIERGRLIEHVKDYTTEMKAPWEMPERGFADVHTYPVQSQGWDFDEWTQSHFVNDLENPYQTDPDAPFNWIRSYQLGGSLTAPPSSTHPATEPRTAASHPSCNTPATAFGAMPKRAPRWRKSAAGRRTRSTSSTAR